MKPEKRAPPSTSVIPPSGAGFGKPSEIVSVNPLRKNSIPSVVMNDGTPVVTVRIPLIAPTTAAPQQPEHDGERQREPPLQAEPHHERRHPVDVPEREVDLAGDEQHRLADGEDRDGGGELGDHAQVVRAEEVVRRHAEVDEQHDEDEGDARLLAPRDQIHRPEADGSAQSSAGPRSETPPSVVARSRCSVRHRCDAMRVPASESATRPAGCGVDASRLRRSSAPRRRPRTGSTCRGTASPCRS